jgi:hypothetical protein
MGIVSIAFCEFGALRLGRSQPLVEGEGIKGEILTPTLANQVSAPADKDYVRVATTVAIYMAIGSDPDATQPGRLLVPADCIDEFRIGIGSRVAVALVEPPVAPPAPPAPEPAPQPGP